MDSGRLNFEIRLQPKGASSDFPGWIDLWDTGSAYASIYAPSNILYVLIGGDLNYVTGVTWSAGDTVDFYVSAGGGTATVIGWRTNDGEVHTPTVSGSALGSLGISGALDIAGYATSYRLTSWVQQFRGWNNGSQPTWVRECRASPESVSAPSRAAARHADSVLAAFPRPSALGVRPERAAQHFRETEVGDQRGVYRGPTNATAGAIRPEFLLQTDVAIRAADQ